MEPPYIIKQIDIVYILYKFMALHRNVSYHMVSVSETKLNVKTQYFTYIYYSISK